MQYDPIKRFLTSIFHRHAFTRKLFYRMLDILLLRSWHIHRALKAHGKTLGNNDDVHVLDAGSGLGQYTWYMAKKFAGWQVTAIDIKNEEIASCKIFFEKENMKNVRFETRDLTTYAAPDAFDLILSVDVMEHIEDDRKVFENFHRSLKDGGMLLISTPSDQGGSDVHSDGDASFIEEHVRDGYAASDIEEKLRSAGFANISTKYSYGKPGSIAWRLSMKYPVLMLGRSKAFLLLLPFYYIICMPLVLLLNTMDTRMKHRSGTGLIVKAYKGRADDEGMVTLRETITVEP